MNFVFLLIMTVDVPLSAFFMLIFEICPEMQAVAKMATLEKFRQGCGEIIRANTLTQLEGPGNVGEFGDVG